MNLRSSFLPRLRRGYGIPAPLGPIRLALFLVGVSASCWWIFGQHSVGAMVAVTPLILFMSSLFAGWVATFGGFVLSRRRGFSPFLLSIGPVRVRWSSHRRHLGVHGRQEQFYGAFLATTSSDTSKSVFTASQAKSKGEALGALVPVFLAIGAGCLAVWTKVSWQYAWCGFATALPALLIVAASAHRYSKVSHLTDPNDEIATVITDSINRMIQMGVRPRLWPAETAQKLDVEQPLGTAGAIGASYFTYIMLLDQGSITEAGIHIEKAAQDSLDAIRAKPLLAETVIHVFAEMAFYCARFRADAECGRSWLALCDEYWIEPALRLRAETAIQFASGDYAKARVHAESARRILAHEVDFGDAQAEIELVDSILQLCKGEEFSDRPADSSVVARQRAPLVVNVHGGELATRLFPFLAYIVIVLVAGTVAPNSVSDINRVLVSIGVVALTGVAVGLFALKGYGSVSQSWIEVSEFGVRYVTAGSSYRIEWADFRPEGVKAPVSFKKDALNLYEPIAMLKPWGPHTQFQSVPIALFSRGWRQNRVGSMIRRYAPDLVKTSPS